MYKKSRCTCRVVVLLIQPIAFLTFSLSSPSWHLKVPSFMQLRYLRPSSTSPYVNEESGFWNPGNFACGIRNPGLQNQEYSTRIRNRTWNPESKFHWQTLESSTWNPESAAWISESKTVLDSLTVGRLTLLKRKDEPLPSRNIDWKVNICERNWAECSGKAKTIMRKCIFACVNKTLLLLHSTNCRLRPVDYFPVSCGSYVYNLVISQPREAILWYISFTLYYLVFALHFLVFALCLIKLHCSQPILRFKNFFMSIIMMKNRLHSNNSLSSNSFNFSLVLPEKKNTYAYRHSIYYKNVI